MLLSQDARDLYEETSAGWERLGAWLSTSASTTAGQARASIEGEYKWWKNCDQGAFSDPDLVATAHAALLNAEDIAAEYGYPLKRAGGDPNTDIGTGHEVAPGTNSPVSVEKGAAAAQDAAGEAMNAYCKEHPDNAVCKATDPSTSTCAKLGLPEWPLCGGSAPWWAWAAGIGIPAALVGLLYLQFQASKKAAPYIVPLFMPEAVPVMRAIQQQQAADAMGRSR